MRKNRSEVENFEEINRTADKLVGIMPWEYLLFLVVLAGGGENFN